MALYTTVMDTITTYTGLSLAAFFTIAALMFVVYKTVCGMFVDPEHYDAKKPVAAANLPEPPAISEPVQLGDVKEEELTAYDELAEKPSKPPTSETASTPVVKHQDKVQATPYGP
ncbi:hypothetical protein ACOSQ2_014099 [Xanthoceras sorbifolium]